MANVLYPPPRPQSVGEILDSAFRIFRATLVRCLPYAIAAVIAGLLPNIYYLATGRGLVQTRDPLGSALGAFWYYLATERTSQLYAPTSDPIAWVLSIVVVLITVVLWGAMLLRQYALATGHPVETGVELATPLRRLPGVLLLFIATLLAIHVWVVPVLAIHGALRLWVLLALTVPASLVGVALSCSWPLFMLTGKGAVESLRRSWRLTSGSWLRLILIYTVAFVLLMVFYVILGLIFGIVAAVSAGGDLATATAIAAVSVALMSVLVWPFGGALMLAVLGDLSVRREGADLALRVSGAAAP